MCTFKVLEVFPSCLWKRSNVCLNDDGPFSSFQARLMSISSPYAFRPPGDCWCTVPGLVPTSTVLRLVNTLGLRCKAPVMVAFYLLSFPLTPACPGQSIQRSLQGWMLSIDTCHSGLLISLFTFCSKLIESVRMIASVVWLSTSWGSPMERMSDCFKLEVETI